MDTVIYHRKKQSRKTRFSSAPPLPRTLSLLLLVLPMLLFACSTPTPVVIVVTATPLPSETAASGLLATFTPTSQPSATPLPPTATPEPQATATPAASATPVPAPTASFITWDEAAAHVGEEITLCGPVMGAHYAESSQGKPTFLNIGEPYPNPARFTVVIWGDDRANFPGKPEELYTDQEICITSTIEEYDGALEMVVSEPAQIVIQ
jgi:hypothetical protein